MSTRVRFVSSIPALCWDPDHHRMVKVVRSIDTQGRQWEEYSVDGPGKAVLVQPPDEPQAKRLYNSRLTARKK